MVAYKIFSVLASTVQIFSFLLLIRVLLTWFPGIDWSNGALSAWFIEFISELVISERSFFVIGLPFKYRTASTLVTRSISDIGVVFRSDWLILITEIFPNLP